MNLLAIDPGPQRSQWLLYDAARAGWAGYPMPNAHARNDELADAIRRGTFCCTHVAVEFIASYGMPVGAEVFETCYFIGQLIEICASLNLPLIRCYRTKVKGLICKDERAKDANVRRALLDIFGPPGTKEEPGGTYGISKHAWSALAVAWYAANQLRPAGVEGAEDPHRHLP